MTNTIARVDDTTNIFYYNRTKLGKRANKYCGKYVTSNIHEQTLVIDNFCLPHKNWQTSFSANVLATSNPTKCPHVHEQIKLVT